MSSEHFRYTAIDPHGVTRKGTITAESESDALRMLSADGLTPVRVAVGVAGEKARPALFSKRGVRAVDVAGLTRELSVLVNARIPLGQGLASIAEHETRPAMRDLVVDIAQRIEAGSKITEALEAHPEVFDSVYVETIRAAEKTGQLAVVLAHLAEMLDKQIETSQGVRRALTYPVVVLSFVAVALSVIVMFVVPRFATIFEQNNVELPLATRLVTGIGESIKGYWWAYAAAIAAVVFGSIKMWRSDTGRLQIERALVKMPYFGKLMLAVTAARFTRVLSICMGAGLDLIEAIDIGGRATGRPLFALECAEMVARLRGGEALSHVVKDSIFLPGFAKRMLGAGKDASELADAADVVAKHYDREASHITKNVNTIVEPLITVAMAGIVLLVALSVFLPMWQMIKINK